MKAFLTSADEEPLALKETRFARLEAIDWWDQELLAKSRVLVVGAGALGNEVIKNLALLGIGHVVIVDMDCVELSNLSRSILFRECDEGKPKVECAAKAAREIFTGSKIQPVVANVVAELGLGYFRWANVIIGALDNREARVFVNGACARVGRPWFDGGIEVLHGVVRGFSTPSTACYECTMSTVDWELLNKRRSCSLLARRAIQNRGTPTTPTTASIIAAIQVQETVKYLHNRNPLLGRGFVYDGGGHASYSVTYPVNPECSWHEPQPKIESCPQFDSTTPLETLWAYGAAKLGAAEAIDFGREVVAHVECAQCGLRSPVFRAAEKIGAEELICPKCQVECAPLFIHSIGAGSTLLKMSAQEVGLPAWDIVWIRNGLEAIGLELTGDSPINAASCARQIATKGNHVSSKSQERPCTR